MVFHKPYPVAQQGELVEIPKEITRDKNSAVQAQRSALQSLQKLLSAAQTESVSIIVLSAFRPYELQNELFHKAEQKYGKGKGIRWLAPPGYSEHHTGYVFDLADKNRPETDDEPSFEQTPAFHWLSAHAKEFGFELSFPKGNWQNIGYEPWHWRFTGDPKSARLFHPPLLRKCCIVLQSLYRAIS